MLQNATCYEYLLRWQNHVTLMNIILRHKCVVLSTFFKNAQIFIKARGAKPLFSDFRNEEYL